MGFYNISDMIAVSSTVIPVPEYNIHTNIENVESADDKTIKSKFSMMFPLKQYFMKMHKADEPYKLITGNACLLLNNTSANLRELCEIIHFIYFIISFKIKK